MIPERQPSELIEEKITLLNSEEKKIRQEMNNLEASPALDAELRDIQRRQNYLQHLYQIIGNEQPKDKTSSQVYQNTSGGVHIPGGRFGSRLINYDK